MESRSHSQHTYTMDVIDQASSQPRKLGYRPDIDGLRAVAVLLVVFDHLHLVFLGGYIGVDVFFVISGYLISSIILSEMSAGRFSILSFYERRIRRIFPALLVMMVVVALLAYRFLVPSETTNFAQSMVAATFSFSNVLFMRQSGYFDQPSQLKPLLHTGHLEWKNSSTSSFRYSLCSSADGFHVGSRLLCFAWRR